MRLKQTTAAKSLLAAIAFAVVGVALLGALSACGPHGPINWPGLVQCAPGVSDLVGTVSRILVANQGGGQEDSGIADRAKTELEDLAREHGTNTIACLVQRVISDWTSPGAAQDPVRLAAAQRGQDFLGKVGTTAQLQDGE